MSSGYNEVCRANPYILLSHSLFARQLSDGLSGLSKRTKPSHAHFKAASCTSFTHGRPEAKPQKLVPGQTPSPASRTKRSSEILNEAITATACQWLIFPHATRLLDALASIPQNPGNETLTVAYTLQPAYRDLFPALKPAHASCLLLLTEADRGRGPCMERESSP